MKVPQTNMQPTRNRTRRLATLLCAGPVLALAAATVSAQGNLGFLRNTPMSYFNAEDVRLMRAAAAEVLKSKQDGTRKEWQNPASGNGGAITLLRQFSAPDGRQCGQVRLESHARTMENAQTMSVCRTADGRWQADTAGPPPG
ncbi:MAG TPA: RT0821/Lpp0805 family surface protein [Steroidobacteraceae bacterium]|jgi:surface antigen